jgi:fatty acid desaturase
MLLGTILSLPIGTAYFPFEEYRLNHIRHHVEKIDVIGFDVQAFVNKLSPFWRWALTVTEGLYFPTIFFIVKIQGVMEILKSKGAERRRAVVAGLGYGVFFLAILSVSPPAIIWLFIAVLIRIHCIRLVDAFQHTYDQIPQDVTVEKRSRQYEQNKTFSFPVFKKIPVLNLLFLNFGFHNAHHAAPGCPWYRLPKADSILSGRLNEVNNSTAYSCTPQIGIWEILSNYHRHRIDRIIKYDQENVYDEGGNFLFHQFRGALTDNLLG